MKFPDDRWQMPLLSRHFRSGIVVVVRMTDMKLRMTDMKLRKLWIMFVVDSLKLMILTLS